MVVMVIVVGSGDGDGGSGLVILVHIISWSSLTGKGRRMVV